MFTESCLIIIIALACLYRLVFVCTSQDEIKREMTTVKNELVSEVATSTCIRVCISHGQLVKHWQCSK